MSKQDRQGARTPADLERKYNFGQSFAEAMGLANDARDAAENAQKTASEAKTEIIRLADSITLSVTGGEPGNKASIVLKVGDKEYSGEINLQGMVTFESLKEGGKTTINGGNVMTGVISSEDGTVQIDLDNKKIIVNGMRGEYKTRIEISETGFDCYGESKEMGKMENTMSISLGAGGLPPGIINYGQDSTGLVIATSMGELSLGTSEASTSIYGSGVSISPLFGLSLNCEMGDVFICGRPVYWKDNGDGTSSLVANNN